MTVTADNVVILALAENDVTAGHTEDNVVAGLAVDQISRAVVGNLRPVRERCAIDIVAAFIIRAAQRIVELLHGARDDLQSSIVIVVEGQEFVSGRGHQAINVGVVTHDKIGIPGVTVWLRRYNMSLVVLARQPEGGVADIVSLDVNPRPSEDKVGSVGAHRLSSQTEQFRTAADHFVLAQAAVHQIGAAIAFHVVVGVCGGLGDIKVEVLVGVRIQARIHYPN